MKFDSKLIQDIKGKNGQTYFNKQHKITDDKNKSKRVPSRAEIKFKKEKHGPYFELAALSHTGGNKLDTQKC